VTIEVEAQVFSGDGEHWNETVIITGSSDPQAAALALRRAGERFYAVAEDGRELVGEDAEAVADDLYTPNYVSHVRLAPRGPWCYVDCKGYVPPPMRERMIAILVEELEHGGIDAHVEVPSDEEMDYTAPAVYRL
jgi:hypothetical protein